MNNKVLDKIEMPRIQRLKEKLRNTNFTAIWRQGAKHTVVDVFSRYPVSTPVEADFEGEHEMED